MSEYGLGRVPAIDFRDRRHMATVAKRVPASRTSRHWITAKPLDQGNTSQCVAYSWEQYLLSSPVKNRMYKTPADLYNEAQMADEWPGEDYDGTSVRAGAKVLQYAGYLKEYQWAFDVEAAVRYMLTTGPIVLGTDWYETMFYPFEYGKDRQTFIRMGGPIAGGHAYLWKGVNLLRPCFCGELGAARIINSWGAEWGDGGKAWMCLKEVGKLIAAWGECSMSSEIRFEPVV
jgi:hypothetical protein